MGSRIRVASSMIHRVRWLDDASQTVSPAAGWLDEGRMKGNSAKPAVRITPANEADEARNDRRPARPMDSRMAVSSAPHAPAAGASHIAGQIVKLRSQPPVCSATLLVSGLEGAPGSTRLVMAWPWMPYATQKPPIRNSASDSRAALRSE